jgi:hypothetical protein
MLPQVFLAACDSDECTRAAAQDVSDKMDAVVQKYRKKGIPVDDTTIVGAKKLFLDTYPASCSSGILRRGAKTIALVPGLISTGMVSLLKLFGKLPDTKIATKESLVSDLLLRRGSTGWEVTIQGKSLVGSGCWVGPKFLPK